MLGHHRRPTGSAIPVPGAADPVVPRVTQSITATVRIAGPQQLRLQAHGSGRERGSHLSVASDDLLIYLHDQAAARVYAGAWIDAWYLASQLPQRLEPTPPRSEQGPVMLIRGYGTETVQHLYDPARRAVMIRLGGLTWLVYDQAAWQTSTDTWWRLNRIAPDILASSYHPDQRPRRRPPHAPRPEADLGVSSGPAAPDRAGAMTTRHRRAATSPAVVHIPRPTVASPAGRADRVRHVHVTFPSDPAAGGGAGGVHGCDRGAGRLRTASSAPRGGSHGAVGAARAVRTGDPRRRERARRGRGLWGSPPTTWPWFGEPAR